jgi:hypothetical protein
MSPHRRIVLAGCLFALFGAATDVEAKKCKGNEFRRASCKAKKAVKKATRAATDVVERNTRSLGPIGDVATAVVKVTGNVLTESAVAVDNVARTEDKARSDVAAELKRAEKNVGEAIQALKQFAENEVKGMGDTLSDAERRFRQGKVADAFWHAAIDPYRHREANIFKAASESSLINTVGQVAASAYGGPQGAAAYSAWFTYRQTKDFNLALKVGLITGATNAGFGVVQTIPSDELFKKTVLAATIGGIGVAASGGDDQQVLEGFLRSGGMVLIQDGYQRMTGGNLTDDAKVPNGPSYCMQALPGTADCAPPDQAYVRNKDGSIAKGPDGQPKIDVRYIDHTKPVVGLATGPQDARSTIGRIGQEIATDKGIVLRTLAFSAPGLNAGALFHDQWVMVAGMSAAENLLTIGPAIVLVYNGTAAPINDVIQEAAVDAAREDGKAKEPTRPQRSYMCSKDDVQRAISVQTPTEIPELACAVLYEKKAAASLPWVALNDPTYCFKRASEFVAQHQEWGWTCYVRDDAKRTADIAAVK